MCHLLHISSPFWNYTSLSIYIFNENLRSPWVKSSLSVMQKEVGILSPSFIPTLGLWEENNKLNASDVCGCGLINLCSKLFLHTISLPIDLQVLKGRTGAKVWRCGTNGGNRPRFNCLFFASWSYWQLPLSQPLRPSSCKTNQRLLIAMAFSSSQIKHLHTSQKKQHSLRPLASYCKYRTELRVGQVHHHYHYC